MTPLIHRLRGPCACAVVALVVALSACRADAEGPAARELSWRTSQNEDAQPADPDALVVNFGPAGYIAGRPASTSLQFRTPYAEIAVIPEHLASVYAGVTTNRLTLNFHNGDSIVNVALLEPLRLDTALGPVSLQPDAMVCSQPNLDRLKVAFQLTDGTRLTGEPSGADLRAADGAALPWADVLRLDAVTNAPSRFIATLVAGGTADTAAMSAPLRVDGPFGSLHVPWQVIRRIFVLAAADPLRPQTPLGNVAIAENDTVARAPRGATFLNDGDWLRYDTARGYASGSTNSDFTLRFPLTYGLTRVRFLLLDRDRRSYRYTVDVSADGKTWDSLADRSDGWWRSWQSITFSPRPVRVIRIRGLSNSVSDTFDIVECEAYCHEPDSEREPLWNSGVPDDSAERQTQRRRARLRPHRTRAP